MQIHYQQLMQDLDQTLCATSTTLAANAATTGIGTWTIVSGAGGSFVNANSPTTVFNGVSRNNL